jgi:hypothetical protein
VQSYNGDLGTPGEPNDPCVFGWPIDACYLPPPLLIETTEDGYIAIYGRVYVEGLTDETTKNDASAADLSVEIGFGEVGTDPATHPSWGWASALGNPDWDGALAMPQEPAFDEYFVDGALPDPGTYEFAMRVSGDVLFAFEPTWTYCDGGVGSIDGYASADAGRLVLSPSGPQDVLMISEYVEGGSIRAIEIWNPSAVGVSLVGCVLDIYADGAAVPVETLQLGDALQPGDVMVRCAWGYDDDALCDGSSYNLDYDGNDAIVLSCGGSAVDVIGQVGFDPGTAWSANGVSTADQTLRRACSVTVGDPDGSDPFDPSLEWTGHPADDFADLGMQACP